MESVMTAPLAILHELDAIGVVLLVFLGRVVTALTLSAGQCDQSTHNSSYLMYKRLNNQAHKKIASTRLQRQYNIRNR
jgi:hypothetical protein